MRRYFSAIAAAAWIVLGAAAAVAGGRTVIGTVTRLDPPARTLTVKDDAGVPYAFKVDRKAGIDLRRFKIGDRVRVDIARATPPNMMSAADILRQGDTVTPVPAR